MKLKLPHECPRLPKDRPWGRDTLAHYGAVDFFLRKGYSVSQIALEINRTPEWIRERIKELPQHLPRIERDKALQDELRMARGAAGLFKLHHVEAV